MSNTTNTTTAKATMSYVLTGKRENQATAKATAAAKATTDNTTAAALLAATAFAANAKDTTAAKKAANMANDAAAKATKASDTTATAAAKELALNALSVAGVYAYMDATAAEWVSMRDDVKAARFERHNTAKASSMRLVVSREGKGDIYLTVNTTASMDWRKIDAAYNKRLANQAKKEAEKAAKAAAKKATKKGKKATKKAA